MKKTVKTLLGLFTVLLLLTAYDTAADAHGRFRGSVIIGPVYDPWYDPWYGSGYPYYPPYSAYPAYPPRYYAPADYGYLWTQIEPNQAQVWVDGKFFGIVKEFDGPVNHLKLSVGTHEVQFRLKGYRAFTTNVYISPLGTASVEYDLSPVNEGKPGDGREEEEEEAE